MKKEYLHEFKDFEGINCEPHLVRYLDMTGTHAKFRPDVCVSRMPAPQRSRVEFLTDWLSADRRGEQCIAVVALSESIADSVFEENDNEVLIMMRELNCNLMTEEAAIDCPVEERRGMLFSNLDIGSPANIDLYVLPFEKDDAVMHKGLFLLDVLCARNHTHKVIVCLPDSKEDGKWFIDWFGSDFERLLYPDAVAFI